MKKAHRENLEGPISARKELALGSLQRESLGKPMSESTSMQSIWELA